MGCTPVAFRWIGRRLLSDRRNRSAPRRTIRRLIPWPFVLGVAAVAVTTGRALPQVSQGKAPIEFNIPAQPLDVALGRYGDLTGREALFDTSLAAGRVSGEVKGALAPDEALRRLLSGTGLAARFVAENAFVLLAMPRTHQRAAKAVSAADRRYYGLIQKALLDALCRSRDARPGHYRFVVMFWIGADGRIEKPRRIGSTGAINADQQIDATLQDVRFSAPPPAGFAQPVLILIVPQAPGVTPGCGKADAGPAPIDLP